MNAAVSVPETFPQEGANRCHVLVAYEDAVTHDLAMEVCGGVMARFETDLKFAFSFWNVRDLGDPVSTRWAAEAAACADIILFSLSGHDLTPETGRWLEMCAGIRTKTEGAIAVMLKEPSGASPAGPFLSRLQLAAHRLRMDFLPLLPPPGPGSGTLTGTFPAILPVEREEEAGSNHWGLNE